MKRAGFLYEKAFTPKALLTTFHATTRHKHNKQTYFNFYGTLPLAELASIFGEQLVFERLVAEADVRDQLALYADKIEGIFASVFRQAAMFRFEQAAHQKRRSWLNRWNQ
jgi:oligoendopeptidase F